ncbi:multiple sugar transport system substrate-binding protein [Paenibacillus uliginis N3/975]|uniref:Multiple sugar transport system substrate-binding protein n=1 Tax=Paenibacillus uliginis N3/975 TaxID=1313296 RepID=A0A1X7HP00_9BACL|nr:extracellular solute-binding protein [Paenibacillus uliginis]SMF90037.1 multiple sugar transport system substrate-binding protein [Paenibacillus uliginis N3/975]
MNEESDKLSFQEKLDRMVHSLRSEIINGIRKPGAFLPSESALAKQFKISNKTVRKGLELLVEEELIVKIDRVGSMVSKEQKPIIVNFGCNPSLSEDIVMDQLLEEFHRLHPAIHVRAIPLDFFEHVTSAGEMLSSGMLDVVSFNNWQFQEMCETGTGFPLLEPLESDDGIYRVASEAFRHEGQLYARVVSFSPVVLCYNKEHFQEAKLQEPDSSWTWDDLLDTARKLTKYSGRHSIYFVPAALNRYPIFLLHSGLMESAEGVAVNSLDELDGNTGRKRNNAPGLAYSLRKLSDIVNDHTIFPKYFSGSSEDDSISLFMQERVSIILTTYFSLNAFKERSLSYDISPVPLMNRGGEQKTLLVSIGVAVNRRSKEKEAARTFAEFLASPAAQAIIREKTISIPSRKMIAEEAATEDINRPSRYSMYRELFPSFMYHNQLGLSIHSMKQFSSSLKEFWSDIIDEKELYAKLESYYSDNK